MSDSKVCTKCGEEKGVDLFHWHNKKTGTRRGECKACSTLRCKELSDNKRKACSSCQVVQGARGFQKDSETCNACVNKARESPHRLQDIDPDTQKGVCVLCGPVQIVYRAVNGGKGWQCVPGRHMKNLRGKLPKYGLTLDDYLGMLEQQGGVCFACKDAPPQHRRLCVDHNHQTGAVRALLCSPCNTTLGMSKESIPRLQALIRYLENFSNQ